MKGGQAVAEGKDDSGNGGTPLIDFHSLMGLCETMDSVWFLAKLIELMEMLLRMLQLASRNLESNKHYPFGLEKHQTRTRYNRSKVDLTGDQKE